MAKNINEEPFDDSTKLKLEIFGETFNEWLPVFINDRYTDQVYIFDFFAGSGTDINGISGSPLILIEKAKGNDREYCRAASKSIEFVFNESKSRKARELSDHVREYFSECKKENDCSECVYHYQIIDSEFQPLFERDAVQNILKDPTIGKFVLLDQYGFKEINENVFKQLVEYPRTDFIFFISSSFIKRFKEQDCTKRYIDTERIRFDESKPNEVHRIIADYFKQLIPKGKEYYIHQFSIQKERNRGNYYGCN